MKQKLLISALVSGLLLGTTLLQAKSATKTLVQQQVLANQKGQQKAPKEILNGLKDTFVAMDLLQNNKIKEAKKRLKWATNDFDKALKNNLQLDIVPIAEDVRVTEFIATPKEIKKIIKDTIGLLNNNKTQEARALLLPMKDELTIVDTAIPMKLYPLSTKDAIKALNKGDTKGAMDILANGFSTLISTQVTIPLSLLTAEDLVLDASVLAKTKKEEATKLLDGAKELLEKARLLGYTNKHDKEYKALNQAIEDVIKEIKGKNEVEKLYDKVKNKFKSLIGKTKNDKIKISNSGLYDSLGEEESKVLVNPSDTKGKLLSSKAKVEETNSKDAFEAKETKSLFTKEAKSDEAKIIK